MERIMSVFSLHTVENILQDYGYGAAFVGLMLESIGFPLPGESLMIAAAIAAATTHQLNIYILVPVAAAGAILGDQIGYLIGHSIGFRVLARFGKKIGLSQERLDLGRYLFKRYGGTVVFGGRFIAVLRTFAALLAGANHMPWPHFLLWNAAGGLAWTCLYGFGAYLLGTAAKHLSGPVGIGLGIVGVAALIAAFLFIKRNEKKLLEDAKREMQKEPAPAE
jgi:membrane protein DedA with SNARE-associated domain